LLDNNLIGINALVSALAFLFYRPEKVVVIARFRGIRAVSPFFESLVFTSLQSFVVPGYRRILRSKSSFNPFMMCILLLVAVLCPSRHSSYTEEEIVFSTLPFDHGGPSRIVTSPKLNSMKSSVGFARASSQPRTVIKRVEAKYIIHDDHSTSTSPNTNPAQVMLP